MNIQAKIRKLQNNEHSFDVSCQRQLGQILQRQQHAIYPRSASPSPCFAILLLV